MKHVLSIDLESWVHRDFNNWTSKKRKELDNGYLKRQTDKILKTFKKNRTTFFIPGEVNEWDPSLVSKIADAGHEIGFHTHSHKILSSKKRLLRELKLGRELIEEFNITGFRAPQMYIKREYFRVLDDFGFEYDSSVYAKSEIYEITDGFKEIPVSTYPVFGSTKLVFPRNLTIPLIMKEIPYGSGYFIGIFGNKISKFILNMEKKNVHSVLFLHPWQMEIKQNMKEGIGYGIKMKPYNVQRKATLEHLCANHNFTTINKLIKEVK